MCSDAIISMVQYLVPLRMRYMLNEYNQFGTMSKAEKKNMESALQREGRLQRHAQNLG
jgi:hypothetical protein